MSQSRSIGFKLVKYVYVFILALSLIGSVVLSVFGLYALSDNEDHIVLYENIMHYYGIDESQFPVFNDSNLTYAFNNLNDDNLSKQSFFGIIMVFVGVVSMLFELIALFGAVKENIAITLTVTVLIIIGNIYGYCTTKSIDTCTFITQLLFVASSVLFLVLLRRELKPKRKRHSYSTDVEMNNSRNKHLNNHQIDQTYIDLNGGPPPYNEFDHNKNDL